MNTVYLPESLKGLHAWILGLARSGIAAARLLNENGMRVFVTEIRHESEVKEDADFLRSLGIEVQSGGHRFDNLEIPEFAVLSPGIPLDAPAVRYLRDKGCKLYSEIEVASWFHNGIIVSVTGSNGKTTVTTWIAHLLRGAGYDALAAGNIGYPFCDLVRNRPKTSIAVVETSSYQLETIKSFHPKIAVITNISPDHLERHKTMEEYTRIKARIWENQSENDLVIIPVDDESIDNVKQSIPGNIELFSTEKCPEGGAGIHDNMLVFVNPGENLQLVSKDEIPVPGRHNTANALATALVARKLEVSIVDIREGMRSFPGLPHRLEIVGENGRTWVNDSKATNVESLRVALEAVQKPVWLIAGGRDKGDSYSPIEKLVREKVDRLLLIGEGAERLERELGDVASSVVLETLENAVNMANREAEEGTTVLLSPGCASFDQFKNFEDRGDYFRKLVGEVIR